MIKTAAGAVVGTTPAISVPPVGVSRFLRIKAVCAETGLPVSTLYDKMAKGAFPKPVKIGGEQGRAVAWLEDEVVAWKAERIKQRDRAAA